MESDDTVYNITNKIWLMWRKAEKQKKWRD
jgi:hypothetical protein